jgi:hypothetical protein
MFPQLQFFKTIPVQLDGVIVDDNYADMTVQTQRTVIQTFSFTAKMDFFGPIFTTDKIIKRTIVDIATKNPMDVDVTLQSEVVPFDADKEDLHKIVDTRTYHFGQGTSPGNPYIPPPTPAPTEAPTDAPGGLFAWESTASFDMNAPAASPNINF